jgi:hypothetical protein
MTTTKNDIIRQALKKLAVTGFDSEVDPSESESALIELESMMAEWDGQGIRVGYNLAVTPEDANGADAAGILDFSRNAIVYNLAIRVAPEYGKEPSAAVVMGASQSMSRLFTAIHYLPISQYPRRMPRGSGNTMRDRGYRSRFYDNQPSGIDVENDGFLDGVDI